MALSPVNLVMMVYCVRSLRIYNVQDYLCAQHLSQSGQKHLHYI